MATRDDHSAMSERRFGPSQHGQIGLAVVLGIAAAAVLCFGFVMGPSGLARDASDHGKGYALLMSSVLVALAVAAWRWKPSQAEILISDDGVSFHARGRFPVARATLAWREIARIEHRDLSRGARFLVIVAGPDAAQSGREHAIFAGALEDDFADVIAAMADSASRNGWQLVGPRPRHTAGWFNGMNWRFEPLVQVRQG